MAAAAQSVAWSGALNVAVLAGSGLCSTYGRREVLRGVDVAVGAGEMVGVIGPNGAGKTTIVRVLSGVMTPSRGTVRLDGTDLASLSRRTVAQRVAVLPQDPVLTFPFTALEVVLMGRAPHAPGLTLPTPHDLAIARDAMASLDVADLAGRRLDQLSGGERQRVLLARALAQEPRILLLDEPTSHLDPRHQIQVYDLVRSRARHDGLGVLSVLHDLNLAALYCDRLVLLADGVVAAEGAPADVLREPILARTYGAGLHVGVHDRTGDPIVLPVPGAARGPRG